MSIFNFTGVVTNEAGTFSALCPELDVASQGDSVQEAKAMLLEAVTLYLEGAIEDSLPYLRPVSPEEDPRKTMPDQIVETFDLKVDIAVHAYA